MRGASTVLVGELPVGLHSWDVGDALAAGRRTHASAGYTAELGAAVGRDHKSATPGGEVGSVRGRLRGR